MEETIDPRKSVVTEMQLSDISDDVGTCWRELGPKLEIAASKIRNLDEEYRCNRDKANELLIIWKEKEASGALAGLLADALESIGRKSIAEKLLGPLPGKPCVDIKDNVESNDSNQIDKLLQEIISEMQTNVPTMCKHLEEEGFKVRTKIKELQEKLSNATQKNQEVEQESSKMRARIEKLEKQLQDSKQENPDNFVDHTKDDISDATSNDLDTDLATIERRIKIQLNKLSEQLNNNVTSPLRVPEVKEDKLKTSVMLDLLTRLSESLQEIYSDIQRMVAETCKCNEDVKRDFYDFAYHGLRAEHNDLVHRVNDLESAQAEMSDEEKKEFERLQQYQINRQRQVERLEKLWRGLFTSPERLPEKTCSEPYGGVDSSKKASRRNGTDPGARQKQIKPQEQATSSGTCDDDKLSFTKFKKTKKTTMKNIFKKKESNDNCYPVSYSSHRDS
ncbi:hypothetical protein OS493_030300 [Desmophyllum pertusum]|uniref:Death domain-containing protein n=1 Tax=Desmophyllum pertusum TaxID=174260 RepID=A0A9W9ZK07_9CNID|nr:hypothetical protein OS493_030300 [Desmophyllum pertusum]